MLKLASSVMKQRLQFSSFNAVLLKWINLDLKTLWDTIVMCFESYQTLCELLQSSGYR